MKVLRKFAALFVPFITLLFLFGLSSPAMADSTTDYNQKVAAAQSKIENLQNQLGTANANLDSWTGSSNNQANLINNAQTKATEAKDALEAANARYVAKKAEYDRAYAQLQVSENNFASVSAVLNNASDAVDAAYADWVNAQNASDAADAAMKQAQIDYDTKLINEGGSGKNAAGLVVDVYTGISRYGNPPSRSDVTYTKCKTTTVANIDANWGGGDILGCGSDYVMLHYKGYITYPTTTKVYFQAPADDGFYMSINGTQVINDWSLKGCGANSTGLFSFTGGKSYAIDAWFYEWGGGACSTLNYKPLGGSSYTVAPTSFFTQGAVANMVKDPALLAVLNNKTALYVQAVAAEEQSNNVYLGKEYDYDTAWLNYVAVGQSLSSEKADVIGVENVVASLETTWQVCSDDKAVADAELLDLKNEYSNTFAAIEAAVSLVDTLETQLAQARLDLANIPKPTATTSRKTKRETVKVFAGEAYKPRATFAPIPK